MKLKRREVGFPRLDLPKHHLSSLQLATELNVDIDTPIPEAGFATVFDLDVLFMSASGYNKSGLTHFITAQLLEIDADDAIGFDVSYMTDPTHVLPKPPVSLNHEGELLRWLERDATPYRFECTATFAFEATPVNPILPWFPIPHRPPLAEADTPAPLTEIRGIHAVKLTNDDLHHPDAVEYSIILDRLDNRHAALTVDFSLTMPCTSQVAETALARAREIADGLRVLA